MERLHYQHIEDFLQDQAGGELAGLLGYLRVDDEVQTQRLTIAILKAFGSGQQPAKHPAQNEEVIDTTDPEFVKHFRGFNYEKPTRPQRRRQSHNTEIKIG